MSFPFGTNGKLLFLGVPILKHIRVSCDPSLEFYCFGEMVLMKGHKIYFLEKNGKSSPKLSVTPSYLENCYDMKLEEFFS